MSVKHEDPIEIALRRLWPRCNFWLGERKITVACLIRQSDWRPVDAAWWSGKEVCIIGADLDGNFFLRHCDGTVRYWDHKLQTDTVCARGVSDFVAKLVE